MSFGFAIHANEPLFRPRKGWVTLTEDQFRRELEKRGVAGMEMWGGNYKENLMNIPPHLMAQYLELRPRLLHRDALAAVHAAEKNRISEHLSLGQCLFVHKRAT